MQSDPLVEWQRLTENYRKMYDAELLQLAEVSEDLTETARQALGDELKKRGLDVHGSPDSGRGTADPGLVRNGVEAGEEGDAPPEYTWKTLLCECSGREDAWQICEVLRRAGIECWVEGPGGSYSPFSQLEQSAPRILVAADRLDEARALVSQPIPKEIVELSQMESPEFEAPACPKCGADDPVLEGVDPVNSWVCEACGHEWAEAGAEGAEKGT